jgi:hypothetical protein
MKASIAIAIVFMCFSSLPATGGGTAPFAVLHAFVSLDLQKDVSTNLNRLFCEVTSAGHRTYTPDVLSRIQLHQSSRLRTQASTSSTVQDPNR